MLLCGELFPGSPNICSDEQVSPCLLLTTQSWVSCLMGCIFLSIFWGITYFHPPLIWTQVEALMPFPENEYWKQWGSCYSQVPSADSMDHTGKILTKTEWTILSPCLWEQKLTVLSCFFPPILPSPILTLVLLPTLSYPNQGPRGPEGTPGERGPPGEGFPGPKVTKASEWVEKVLCLTLSWIINC